MLTRFGHDEPFLRKGYGCSKKFTTLALNSCSSVQYPILASSSNESDDSSTSKENESVLILIRHGESMWNEKNLFTGCVDVPLTEKGVEEAIEAGKRIKNMPLDIVYTSALIRSQMTAMLALTEHHCLKVPIILHNENDKAKIWSQIWSKETKKQSIPVVKTWQLNERMIQLTCMGKIKFRNGAEVMMSGPQMIEPQLLMGKHIMVVAHANSLRSMIMYLDKLTSQEVIDLELSTGVPMLYIYKQGKFIRRSSPLGSAVAGVYTYTELWLSTVIYDSPVAVSFFFSYLIWSMNERVAFLIDHSYRCSYEINPGEKGFSTTRKTDCCYFVAIL